MLDDVKKVQLEKIKAVTVCWLKVLKNRSQAYKPDRRDTQAKMTLTPLVAYWLEHERGMNESSLATYLDYQRVTVRRHLHDTEESGLIWRDENKLWRPTDAGMELCLRIVDAQILACTKLVEAIKDMDARIQFQLARPLP